jgi:hypothetical protein
MLGSGRSLLWRLWKGSDGEGMFDRDIQSVVHSVASYGPDQVANGRYLLFDHEYASVPLLIH